MEYNFVMSNIFGKWTYYLIQEVKVHIVWNLIARGNNDC